MADETPDETQDQSSDITLQEIIIQKKLKEDGQYIWSTSFKDFSGGKNNDLIPLLDGLGLLEAAKADFLLRHDLSLPEDLNSD